MRFKDMSLQHWHCKWCVFYDDRDSTCKKNPPTKVALEIGFPYVDKHDFCGEWRDRQFGQGIEFP